MLTEIERKVASLLESCKDRGPGDSGATQQEAEALSVKLKTVKCNLEKVQIMLQEKYSEDQVKHGLCRRVGVGDMGELPGRNLAEVGKQLQKHHTR